SEYLIKNVAIHKKRVYALRGSRDDEGLKKQGFIFDPDIFEYFGNLSVNNIRNLIYRVVHREFDASVAYGKVEKHLKLGIYHTDAETIFNSYKNYFKWYKNRKHYNDEAPWIGMTLFSSSLIEGQVETIDYIIKRLEDEGFNVVPAFGRAYDVLTRLLMDRNQHARVDLVLAFTLKFQSSLNKQTDAALIDLNVPVINAINLYSLVIDEWRDDPIGIPPLDVVWNIANPEISGLVEPTPLTGKVKVFDTRSGKTLFVHKPIKENIRQLIPRLKMWIKLKHKANENKRVAILYYNHSQGKQNIGASYLNVFRSLELIFSRMKEEGYRIEMDEDISEEAIKELILKYGRNIGSWAPGELDKMIRAGKVLRLPIAMYKKWFDEQPEAFKQKVIQQWGHVEDSNIMIKNGELIIPAVMLGNVVVMPEPSRGWGDDPMKLYHDPTVYPHHQYIAAYLWLRFKFKADAMIHLGTHATYEWLPGKQAGLTPADPPEIKMTDIPNIYPYIVDDVGEGIQAKRRGRGVLIDHLTPAVKEGGLYQEYARLYEMISDYNQSLTLGSKTAPGKLEKMKDLIIKTGLHKDLAKHVHPMASSAETDKLSSQLDLNEEFLEEIEHYLLEIRENFMPYGLHTFGVSPDGEALRDTVKAIIKNNRRIKTDIAAKALVDSGKREIDHLIKGLNGGYIPSGEGNDPIRNPSAIPTGKNFYGFSPDKIPSQAAWDLGQKAAQEIIDKSLIEKGRYPKKVAVVLWATETMRNEGINESTILYLLGLKPVWDTRNRVTGTKVIPGKTLNRPRIDVLINPSGLYRDLFPNMLLFIDHAIQKAAVLTDVENLISKHSNEIKNRLVKSGMGQEQAEQLSKIRIFTEAPGSYGTGVSEMTGNSGFWESDDEIVKVFENRAGFAFGLGKWGEPAKALFKENLRGVDTAIHSVSSNIYGTMDNDDMFQYLGGLSLAIKNESGQTPDTLIAMQRIPDQVTVENVAKTIGRELRTRYLNPKWIEGMKKEDYAGAGAMANFVEYMWGWQVTVPDAVDTAKWEQTYDVYVTDKYGLDLKEFFNDASPWAHQSITGRMLEAIRKVYWNAGEKVQKKLAVEYAVSVIEKGVACCDHTCNNPFLNQMVVNIISLPGVMSPEMVEKFKIAIEQAMQKDLAEQVQARKELQKQLTEGFNKKTRKPINEPATESKSDQKEQVSMDKFDPKNIEGYKLEEIKDRENETTDLSSSGVQWFASLFIVLIIGLFITGVKRRIH
ncbi:MAG: cobaltochelatase subunit CobN, partial [Deltaproteobacteria bacterium]|nr:cobaltochelatase subunit CobN [Deltaproteobacteria bacterium]